MRQLLGILLVLLYSLMKVTIGYTQITDNTQEVPTISKINSSLINIFNQKVPRKYKIANIIVTGSTSFDSKLLINISNLYVGQELVIPGSDAFSKAIASIWKQNYFSNAAVYITDLTSDNELTIEINVTERPRLKNFSFKGLKKSEIEDLTGKVGLVKNRVVTENMKNNAVNTITNFFTEKSYRNVSVRVIETKDTATKQFIDLLFVVNRGSKIKINDIIFTGNKDVADARLKKQMKGTHEKSRFTLFPPSAKGFNFPKKYTFQDYVKEYGFLVPTKTWTLLNPYVRVHIFTNAKFNKEKYEEDKNKILDYYNTLGYRDAVIIKDSLFTDNTGALDILIHLKEGKKYYFGNLTWKGNTKYPDSLLNTIVGIKKGDVYNVDRLNSKLGKTFSQDGNDITSLYTDDGYLFFQCNPVETAVYNDTIDYEIRVIEGPQAFYKNITIVGNDKTRDFVIRRELRTIPGEKFSRTDVIRSQRDLAQLSFFNQEKINPKIEPNVEDGTVDITWEVEEKSSDQLELSAGWGGGIGLTGTIGITFNNFALGRIFQKDAWHPLPSGDGQKLSFRIQSNGPAYQSYNVSFTEPWLGGKKRNAFTFSFFDTKFVNTYGATSTIIPTGDVNSFIRTTGISVGLGKQLKWPDDFFNLSFVLTLSRYKLVNYYIDQVNLPNFNNGFSHNFNFKVALQRSSLDQATFPRSGSNLLMSAQFTLPYSLLDNKFAQQANPYNFVEYHKWRLNFDWYYPLGRGRGPDHNRQFILKFAAKFGYIGRYNQALQISPFERFQVGDAGLSNQYAILGYDIISQRGYPVYQYSDPKVNPDQTSATNFFTIFNKYTLELRYPLSLNPSATIFALGFMEAANGWYSFKEYNPFQLRRSVGLGMRFFLPAFGLIGFDYGVGLDRFFPGATLKDVSRFTFLLGYEPE